MFAHLIDPANQTIVAQADAPPICQRASGNVMRSSPPHITLPCPHKMRTVLYNYG
ncbi:MAG UNVERIFIED_CONTAM: hypothetical protein LVT10_14630 [Anaerolineae bacterium]